MRWPPESPVSRYPSSVSYPPSYPSASTPANQSFSPCTTTSLVWGIGVVLITLGALLFDLAACMTVVGATLHSYDSIFALLWSLVFTLVAGAATFSVFKARGDYSQGRPANLHMPTLLTIAATVGNILNPFTWLGSIMALVCMLMTRTQARNIAAQAAEGPGYVPVIAPVYDQAGQGFEPRGAVTNPQPMPTPAPVPGQFGGTSYDDFSDFADFEKKPEDDDFASFTQR